MITHRVVRFEHHVDRETVRLCFNLLFECERFQKLVEHRRVVFDQFAWPDHLKEPRKITFFNHHADEALISLLINVPVRFIKQFNPLACNAADFYCRTVFFDFCIVNLLQSQPTVAKSSRCRSTC